MKLHAAALALLTATACGPRTSFVELERRDAETGLQVFYAPPDPESWRQTGRIRVEDAYSDGQAERLALKEGRRNGCDGVYLAAINETHEVSGLTALQGLLALGGDEDDRRRAERARQRDLERPEYTARAVCLVRRPVAAPVSVARTEAATAPEPAMASAPVPVTAPPSAEPTPPSPVQVALSSHLGRQVNLRMRDGTSLAGKLAGYDGAMVYLESGPTLRRFADSQVGEVRPAAP